MLTSKVERKLTIPVGCVSLLKLWLHFWIVGQVMGQASGLSALQRMNIDPNFITMSGFSSGGTFAQQMYFSHSSLLSGIAVFSHSYYRCGPITNRPSVFDDVCTLIGYGRYAEYDPNLALRDIQNYARAGLIDDPRNMANKPLYVFAGTQNYLFTPDMSLRILNIFDPFINNGKAVRVRVTNANLTLPSDRPDFPSCPSPPNAISVSNCGFSGALDSLQFLLGKRVVQRSFHHARLQPLITFDQTEFFYGIGGSLGRHDMDSVGFMYVPTVCKSGEVKCFVHFYFHGCRTGREFVGADHILNSGFLEVGEENGIIMVFPQTLSSPVENAIGCWDTYGFTGPLYATKKGGQVTVVRNMLARILGQDSVYAVGHQKYQSPYKHPNSLSTVTASHNNPLQNLRLQYPFNFNYEGDARSKTRCTSYSCTATNYF